MAELIPARCQKDDTNRVDLSARTAWVDVTGASNFHGRTRVGLTGMGLNFSSATV